MKSRRQKGFSLVELIIAVAIVGVLGTMVFTMMNSSSGMYSRSSADSQLQSESQIVANTVNDVVIDCKDVIPYSEAAPYIADTYTRTKGVGGTEEIQPKKANGKYLAVRTVNPNGSITLSRFVYDENLKKLYLITGQLDSTGVESGTQINLLAEYVEDFNVNIDRFLDERIVSYNMRMNKRGVEYKGEYQVYVRNQEVVETVVDPATVVPNLKRVVIDPPKAYVDVKNHRLTLDWYKSNPTSDADLPQRLDDQHPQVHYTATPKGTISPDHITYEWGVNSGATGWAQLPAGVNTADNMDLKLNLDGYTYPDASYNVSVKATGSYTQDGVDKTVSVTATGQIYLRMCRGVTVTANPGNANWSKWDPMYNDTPYNGESSSEAEFYLQPGKAQSFTSTPDLINVLYKKGTTWTLEYNDGSGWKECTDARIAKLSNSGAGYNARTNSVQLGPNAYNGMIFRISAFSEFDNSQYGSYTFGVFPSGRTTTSDGAYSRGYYTDMSDLYYGTTACEQSDRPKVEDVLFFKVTKVDGAGKTADSAGKVKIDKDANGHIRLYVDYQAFAYDGDQKSSFYGGSVGIHYTIGYVAQDGSYVINGQGADTYLNEFANQVGVSPSSIKKYGNDCTYKLGAVTVSKVAPTGDVTVLEKGAGRNFTATTKFYNIREPQNGIYYFGAYLGDGATTSGDMTNNLLENGKGDLNAYFSVRMATGYGKIDEYVDQGTVTLTAKGSQKKYLTDPVTLRITADDYYRIKYDNASYQNFNVVIANVDGNPVYFPGFESTSTATGLKWPDGVTGSTKVNIQGIDTSGNTVSGKVYKDGKYYMLEYGAKKYKYNTTYKYWAVSN